MSATASPLLPPFAGEAPPLRRVAAIDAHEGPVYVANEAALYFTTLPQRDRLNVPRVQIKRISLDGEPAVVRADANAANGMTLGRDGRLLVCEQGTPWAPARITAYDFESGETETLVDSWRGLPLNSPNDVVQSSDGAVWFTDPSYGFLQGFRPKPQAPDRVYRFDPRRGRLTVAADSLDKPNGIALAPDERTLYVTDSGANQEPGSFHAERPHHVVAFDVAPTSGELSNERLFAEISPGFPDPARRRRARDTERRAAPVRGGLRAVPLLRRQGRGVMATLTASPASRLPGRRSSCPASPTP